MIINNSTKVLLVGFNTYDSKGNYVGGTEVVTDALLEYLISKNCKLSYFVTRKLSYDLKRDYENHYKCDVFTKNDISSDLLKSINPDLIIVSVCSTGYAKDLTYNLISKVTDCPVLVYSHGSNCCDVSSSYDIKDFSNFYFTYIDKVALSQHLEYGIPEDHNFRVYNSVFFKDVNTYELNTNYDFDVLSNARIVPQKGVMNLAKLCDRLDYIFAMIGNASSTNQELKRILSINPDFEYLGVINRDQVISTVSRSKFLGFLPNAQEGESPLSVLESMALGTPVITWDDFGITSVVNPEYNIVLNHSDDYIDQFMDEFYPNIDKYLSIDNRMKLREYTINNFGIKKYHEQLDKIISEIGS